LIYKPKRCLRCFWFRNYLYWC